MPSRSAPKSSKAPRSNLKPHAFHNKLVLNQWLLSQFGLDPAAEYVVGNRTVRAFHRLADRLKDTRNEGLDESNLHKFYRLLVTDILGNFSTAPLSTAQLLMYEENIVSHTQTINKNRTRPITWKYHQWLSLLFCEIYLDRYFADRAGLLDDLNAYVRSFNERSQGYTPVPLFGEDELNKLALQNATGSGKTLLMHVNVLQFRHYARMAGRENDLSRIILLTPNESLSAQHLAEFRASGLPADPYVPGGLYSGEHGLNHIDVIEITKLADQQGPNTEATRNLGDTNLLLVDEGHRGMSGKEEGAWLARRAALCAKGFVFEYSATFQQAVAASGNSTVEDAYAKSVLFDYSYRYFYEDGFGKDYQILNLPPTYEALADLYLAAALLKFYQQLRIYEEKRAAFRPFNIEKPLWVFVGSSVEKATGSGDEKAVMSDVARILAFIANFLHDRAKAEQNIAALLYGNGQTTGLLDSSGQDIFGGSFGYLAEALMHGETPATIYADIMRRLFLNPSGGHLNLERVRGDSGEIALYAGTERTPFGLINVGNAKGLADHLQGVVADRQLPLTVRDTEFVEPMFASVRESTSSVNILIGSKKFVEGWDCWRVSAMGLMHVGKSEGSQIIQLFGRGVRLKGYDWSLKRSAYVAGLSRPTWIEDLETLAVFGIEADFMQRFRDFLRDEGLPGNERKKTFVTPLNVTYDFGKRLLVLRPKRKPSDGAEYDFRRDGPVPSVGEIPDYLRQNRIVSDWYTRVQALSSRKGHNSSGRDDDQASSKERAILGPAQRAFLNWDGLYLALEQYKRERGRHNLNISKAGLQAVLADPSWYELHLPGPRLEPSAYANVRLWQQIATELLKRFVDHLYDYHRRAFLEPRLEFRELAPGDDLLPSEPEYVLSVDENQVGVASQVENLLRELQQGKDKLLETGALEGANFSRHLYQPLLHVKQSGRVQVMPVALNDSEYRFISDLHNYCTKGKGQTLAQRGIELYVLRNLSRGQGIGFFEANGFHPDFLLWLLTPTGVQYLTFIEPHGLLREGPDNRKINFAHTIKEIQRRLGQRDVVLNSFVLSWTRRSDLMWGWSAQEYAERHVLFMYEDQAKYLQTLIDTILASDRLETD
jgi:hypothetical protein